MSYNLEFLGAAGRGYTDIGEGYRRRIPARDTGKGYRQGIPARDISKGYRQGIPARDTGEGYRQGIPARDNGEGRILSTGRGSYWPRYRWRFDVGKILAHDVFGGNLVKTRKLSYC